MKLTQISKQKIQKFLDAHEQHALTIKFLSEEERRRVPPGESRKYPVTVKLHCHNGEDWMGVEWYCRTEKLNSCIDCAMAELADARPDLRSRIR
jgi:hypothetical protein